MLGKLAIGFDFNVRSWHRADKLSDLKVRYEREAEKCSGRLYTAWALELAQFGISLLMVEEARENVRNVQKLCGNRQTPIQGCNLILSLLVRYF